MGSTVNYFQCIFLLSFLCIFTVGDDSTTRKPRHFKPVKKVLRWTSEEFEKQALDKVNEFREKHNAKPLELDPILSWDAEEYARKVCQHCEELGACRPYYSHKNRTGENVWVSDTETSVTGDVPVQAWYNEGEKHDFTNNAFNFVTSQFTQLIWKSSETFGIGQAVSKSKKFLVIVARFLPNGNWKYKKAFAENVEPPK